MGPARARRGARRDLITRCIGPLAGFYDDDRPPLVATQDGMMSGSSDAGSQDEETREAVEAHSPPCGWVVVSVAGGPATVWWRSFRWL